MLTVLFFVFFYVVALLPLCNVNVFRPNATIFVVGLATIYVVYLAWTGLASHPDKECNDMIDSGTNTFMQILIGSIFTFMNIWSIAIASADNNGKANETMLQAVIEEKEEETKPDTPEKEQAAFFVVTFQTMFFQGIMVLVSTYFGMLFTNWGYAIIDGEADNEFSNAYFSLYAKLGAQWVTIILFTISVTLYVCDPNRIV